MRYCVNTTCQFRNRLYEKGEIVDLPAGVEVPPYFDALEEAAPDADNTQPETGESVDAPVTNEAPAVHEEGADASSGDEVPPATNEAVAVKKGRKK